MQLCRRDVHRAAIALAVTAVLGAGLFTGAPGAAALPPSPTPIPPASNPGTNAPANPSNTQLTQANARRAVIDQQIGTLSGEIAAAQSRLLDLQRKEELAEQRVAYTYQQYRQAEAAYSSAARTLDRTLKQKQAMQLRFAQYMQATYSAGTPAGMTGVLLTAEDPNALLDQTSYQQYEVQHSVGTIGQMQVISLKSSNAKARTVLAKAKAAKAKKAAEQAQRAAAVAVENQRSEQAGLQATMASKQNELITAKAAQVQLYNQRATYTQYRVELAAYNDYVTYVNKKRTYEAALAADRQRRAAKRAAAAERARKAAERAKREGRKSRGGNNGGGGNGGGSSNYTPPRNAPSAPSGGGWSMAKARKAVARAKSTLGTPYAWAGGGPGGPSYGACVPSAGAPNDCYIRGYDCSGLVMYAWGKNWDHYADTQYNQAGSFHPRVNQLKPGDLVFYGYRGGGSDLHHVAMYVGKGRIIEAPYSGGYVQYNDLMAYSDYYGATRPLT